MSAQNSHVLLVGQPGSGKSTLAREFVRRAWRCVVFDPVDDYDDQRIGRACTIAYGVPTAIRHLRERRDEPDVLIFRPEADDPSLDYAYLLAAIERIQREPDAEPVAVVIDESGLVGDTYEILPNLRRLYNLGRRWRIGIISIAQVDTDIHRVTRRNAQVVVCLRQTAVGTELRRWFGARPAELEMLTPGVRPQAGRHYLCYPDVDLWTWWATVQNPYDGQRGAPNPPENELHVGQDPVSGSGQG